MKKNQQGVGIVELLLVIVVIGLIIGAGWLFFQRRESTTTQKDLKSNAEVLSPEYVTSLIKKSLIDEKYSKQYTIVKPNENSQPKSGEMSVEVTKYSPVYKAAGYDYYTNYDGGSTLIVNVGTVDDSGVDVIPDSFPTEVDMAIRKDIAGVYDSLGMTKVGTNEAIGYDVYTNKTLVCNIENPETTSSSVSASCGSIDAYAKAAEKYKPFVSAIPNVSATTIFTGLKINNSPISGYQNAGIGISDYQEIGGTWALLYRKDSADWKYFTSAQMKLECSKYNTEDLKNAFMGDECLSAGFESDPDLITKVGQ